MGRVTLGGDENVLKSGSGDGHTILNIPKTAKMYALSG